MDIEKIWEKALKNTEIVRARIKMLQTTTSTRVPYIFLAESTVNLGDTIVRKGEVDVQKPSLVIPPNNPQFRGFEFDQEESLDQSSFVNFLIVRGITLPSFIYDNKTHSLDIYEGKLSRAVKHYNDLLTHKEDVASGLVVGPEDCWQLSLLIFICTQIIRNVDNDVKKLLEDYKKKKNE